MSEPRPGPDCRGCCRAAHAWGDIHVVWDSWVTKTAESGLYLADEEDFEVAAISKYGPSLADSCVLLTPCDQGGCCVCHAAAHWSAENFTVQVCS